jgi:hypothetical protein
MQQLARQFLFAANVEGIAISASRSPSATELQEDDMMIAMCCQRSAQRWFYALGEAPLRRHLLTSRHDPSRLNTLLTALRNPSNPLVLMTAFNPLETGRF